MRLAHFRGQLRTPRTEASRLGFHWEEAALNNAHASLSLRAERTGDGTLWTLRAAPVEQIGPSGASLGTAHAVLQLTDRELLMLARSDAGLRLVP